MTSEDMGIEKERPGRAGQRGGVECLTREGPPSRRQGQKLKVPVGVGCGRGRSQLGGMAVGLGGWKARGPPVQGRTVEGPASGGERRACWLGCGNPARCHSCRVRWRGCGTHRGCSGERTPTGQVERAGCGGLGAEQGLEGPGLKDPVVEGMDPEVWAVEGRKS